VPKSVGILFNAQFLIDDSQTVQVKGDNIGHARDQGSLFHRSQKGGRK